MIFWAAEWTSVLKKNTHVPGLHLHGRSHVSMELSFPLLTRLYALYSHGEDPQQELILPCKSFFKESSSYLSNLHSHGIVQYVWLTTVESSNGVQCTNFIPL